jgi:anterior pharynx defective protein 1
MAYLTFFGCLLISLGPSIAFFVIVLSKRATLVIVSIGAGFCWLCGMFVASMLWDVLVPLRGSLVATVPVAVLCTEGARFLFWLIWTKGHQSLNQDAGRKLENETLLLWESVAAGIGCGLCSALLYVSFLWDAWNGPGALLVNNTCFGISAYLLGAITTLLWTVLHIFWNVFLHKAYRTGSKVFGLVILGHHVCLAMLTVFNSGEFGKTNGFCLISLLSQIVSIGMFCVLLLRGRK